jgi:polar amino acid transport system ATP-binding protein
MILEINDLVKSFNGNTALDGVNFLSPSDHSLLTLTGPSGSGKSTLLRIIGGLTDWDAGEISINGTALARDPVELLRHRRSLGFVFQQFNLFPHLTVLRNITLPLEKVHGQTSELARKTALTSLERFGMQDYAGRMPSQLSGGQAQRVALARAIAPNPQRLLLDEPTSALDPEISADVLTCIRQLAIDGLEIILSTHEMGFARALGGRVAYLEAGKILCHAPAHEFFAAPPHPHLQRFLAKILAFEAPAAP